MYELRHPGRKRGDGALCGEWGRGGIGGALEWAGSIPEACDVGGQVWVPQFRLEWASYYVLQKSSLWKGLEPQLYFSDHLSGDGDV